MARYNRKEVKFSMTTPPAYVETTWYMCVECGPDDPRLEECVVVHEYNWVNIHGHFEDNRDCQHIEQLNITCVECGEVARLFNSETEMRIEWGEIIGEPYEDEEEPEEEREVAAR